MRHRVYGRHLNRTSAHRRAMFRNLAAALFEHGEIRTTPAKAKAVQPFVERLVTIAKKAAEGDNAGRLSARRRLESLLNDRRIHGWVADSNVPDDKKHNDYFELPDPEDIKLNRYGELKKSPRLIQHLISVIGPMFADRNGGYTRIVKLDAHRLGDGTDYVILQLVGLEEGPQISGRKSTRRAIADRRTAFAAKLRKGGETAPAADAATAVADEQEPAPEPAAAEEQAHDAPAEEPAPAEPQGEAEADAPETDEELKD